MFEIFQKTTKWNKAVKQEVSDFLNRFIRVTQRSSFSPFPEEYGYSPKDVGYNDNRAFSPAKFLYHGTSVPTHGGIPRAPALWSNLFARDPRFEPLSPPPCLARYCLKDVVSDDNNVLLRYKREPGAWYYHVWLCHYQLAYFRDVSRIVDSFPWMGPSSCCLPLDTNEWLIFFFFKQGDPFCFLFLLSFPFFG